MRTAGQVAFEAYRENRGGKNHDGTDTPDWEGLTDEIREGWETAATAVLPQEARPIELQLTYRSRRTGEYGGDLRIEALGVETAVGFVRDVLAGRTFGGRPDQVPTEIRIQLEER